MLIFHQEALFSAAMATSKTTIDLEQAQDGPSLNRDTSLHHHDDVGTEVHFSARGDFSPTFVSEGQVRSKA